MSLDLSNINDNPEFEIGLCYFDPISEAILEIVPDSGYILGADSYSALVHKIYVATGATTGISKIKVRLKKVAGIEDKFDLKIQPGTVQPEAKSFDEIPNYNTLVIEGPIAQYTLIPVYIYIKANSYVNSIDEMPIELEYEYV